MFYTHGDTVVFRSDRPDRQERTQPRARQREREPRPAEPSLEQRLAERVAQLEERLARLEAELAEAREAGDRPAPRRAGGGARKGQAGEVKVSLHAEGGAQASVGQVRMLSQD